MTEVGQLANAGSVELKENEKRNTVADNVKHQKYNKREFQFLRIMCVSY